MSPPAYFGGCYSNKNLAENGGEWICFPGLQAPGTHSQRDQKASATSHLQKDLEQTQEVVQLVAQDHEEVSAEVNQDGLEPTPPILKLPTEILQHITSYITSDCIACLSLSCKQMLHILGSKSWTALSSKPSESSEDAGRRGTRIIWEPNLLLNLLECLARDDSSLALCRCCIRLHTVDPPAVVEHYFLHRKWSCIDHHGRLYYPTGQGEGYAITGAQVVKALHLASISGNRDSNVDFLRGEAVVQNRRNKKMDYSLSFSARMVDGHLIQRIEHTIKPTKPPSPYERGMFALPLFTVHRVPIEICRHHYSTPASRPWDVANTVGSLFPAAVLYATPKKDFWAWRAEWMRQIVFKRVTKANKYWITEDNQVERCKMQEGAPYIWGCVECATKFRVEWVGRTLKIVVWKNFGKEKSLGREW
jgi:hypothetical protein